MTKLTTLVCLFSLTMCATPLHAADAAADAIRDREMRDRYEKVLLKNPFQERAFEQVYDAYSKVEGVDKWVEAIKPKVEGEDSLAALLLLGQIYDRQFKTAEALAALERAAAKGEERPQFKVLLGTVYYKAGQDEKAAELLGKALDALSDLDQRSAVCRMLGNLYLRQGKRDQAIAVWKRISEQNPGEIFAQLELAEIYEDNRMWTNAIAVYGQIADLSKDDPYRRCRALRSIAQSLVQSEKFKEAIATYEQALELVSPGNWLFEDLKLRLVGVYEDIGDLAGLAKYITAKLEQNPGDIEFRDLLAETYVRMAKFDEAEKQYRFVLERNPRSSSTYEKLIGLYTRMGKKLEVVATFEKLIELFPTDTEYLRRMGERYLRDNNPDKAKETWRRLTKDASSGERLAQLAGWFESYEFPDEAIALYQQVVGQASRLSEGRLAPGATNAGETPNKAGGTPAPLPEQALEKGKNKEWVLRLAALKFQKGDEAEAVRLWLSAIDPASSKVEEYAEIASILEASQKVDEAAKLRKAAVEKDPANLDSHLAYAKILMRQQKFEPAATEFDLLAGQDKNEFLAQQGETGRLDAWRELGVLEEKQKAWEKELNTTPENSKLLGRLARLYERGGQREKAIQLYEHRRAAEPDNVEHLRSLATLYKSAKQTDQAIEIFKGLLGKDKNRARVYQKELLEIFLAVDLKDEAIAAAEQIVSLAPSDPEARLALAQVYQMYRQQEKAFGEYRYALRLEPNEPDYYRQYGEALETEKRFGEAQEAFRKMLDTSKEDTTRLSAVANLSRIYLQQDQLDSLVSEFTRRIRNTPKKLAAYEELAAIHREAGQIFKSVEVLENGLQNVDDKTAALRALVRVGYEAQDFPKVKSYFEQLIAMSGKPTAQEFEKLGQIYAAMGEVEKAKETWNKIVSSAPKDAKAADRLASLLRNEGFTDEALVVKAKAVDLDPNDYRRRYEYAQLLAQTEQPVEALKQLNQILEIGDREESKKEEAKEKKVQKVNRGQQNVISPYQFMYGGRYGGGYYGGGGWQGSFKQFRPQLLQFMSSVAQQSIGEDSFVEQFQARAKKNPDNADLKRDLLAVLQLYNRQDEALKVAQQVLAVAPDDVDLMQQTALFYANEQQLDKAIPLLEKLAKSQPKYRLQAAQGLVPLYFKNKQEDKALEVVKQMVTENANDVQTFYVMGHMLQQNGKYDEAKKMFERVKEIDPMQRNSAQLQLAALAKQAGKPEEALALYREALLAEPPGQRGFSYRPRAAIYSPSGGPGPNRGYYGNPMMNLPQNVFGNIDYQKSQAFNELKNSQKSGAGPTNFLAELEGVARGYQASALPAARNRAWDSARLLLGNYFLEKEFDKAGELLAALRKAGMEDIDWFNVSLYLAQQKEDYAGMIALYEQMQQRYPARARDIAIAKAGTFIVAKKSEESAKSIRELSQQRVPPATMLGLIESLIGASEKKLAKQLLEEHLGTVSRNSQALSMLAKLCGEENDYERAIPLANEAWERKAHGRASANYYYGGYYSYTYYSRYGQTDNLLNELHRYYVAAGKSEELVGKFKERLEKQPASVQAHENLAELYRLGNQRDKALEIYQALADKRPHLMQVKRTIAQLYTETGEFKKATDLYEQLIKANPTLYQQLSWELRDLYQRTGKGKELAKMEDKLVEKARDPNQLSNLAWQLKESGEIDKAIEMWRKAMKMSPGQSYYQSQLAGALLEQGQLEEALKLYQDWLNSPGIRGQGWVDYNALKQLAGLYRATGKLDELKARCETDLKKNSSDQIAKALQTQIALLEKRFDEALAGFKVVVESGRDPNVLQELIHLADLTGRVDEVLVLAEKSDQTQNYWNLQSLARLYFAKGDRKKGETTLVKWAEQQMQQGNASWALRETLQELSQYNCWEAAEGFVRKHRSDPLQQYEAQEFDRQIADNYARQSRFQPIVDEILQKGSFKGRDLDLLKAIVEQYRNGNQTLTRRVFLEKICAADPKNHELASRLAALYDNATEGDKKLTILKRLVEEQPNNLGYRENYAAALVAQGHPDEGLGLLAKWAEEKPLEARYAALARQQKNAARFRDARASWLKAVELADPSRKAEAKLSLADFDAQRGNPEAHKQALRELFEKRKDASAFQRYLRFLDSEGYLDEAYTFFVSNREKGYLDRYQGNEFVTLCLNHSDYKTPMDINWQFTRYGERWNRDYYFDQVSRLYRERGKLPIFIEDFQKRVETEAAKNRGLLEKTARVLEQAGQPDQALAIFDRLVQLSPFNREAVVARANLLVKLKRGDEAVALLRDPKGIVGLDEELAAKQELIRVLFKLERRQEADKEVAEVLSWAKGGSTLQALAEIYLTQTNYTKAAELFEKARPIQSGWNADQLPFNLGKCYAKLGRGEDALKVWGEMNQLENADWQSNNLQEWLTSEGMYDLAAKWTEARLAKNPQNLNLYSGLATALHSSGKTGEAFDVFTRAAKARAKDVLPAFESGAPVPAPSEAEADVSTAASGASPDLRGRLANFITSHNLVDEALKRSETDHSPLLAGALVRVMNNSTGKKERALAIAKQLGSSNLDEPDLQLQLGDALAKLKQETEAAACYRKVLASTNRNQRIAAARGLATVGAAKDSVPILAEVLKTTPQSFITDTNLLIAMGKTADAAVIGQFVQVRTNSALNASEVEYYFAVMAHYSGQSAEARQRLAVLVDAPELTPIQLRMIAAMCGEADLTAERVKVLERLAAGGHGQGLRSQALSGLVKIHAKARALKPAVNALARMGGVWGQTLGEEAREVLAEAVSAENFGEFKEAVLELVRQGPEQDRVSDLLGFCQQVAQRVGQDESAAHLADEAKVTGLERAETVAWDGLIENWEISGPYRSKEHDSIFPPEREYLAKPGDAGQQGGTVWKATDPKKNLGIVRVGKVLGLGAGETAGQVAYARTTINSTDARRATFCLGSGGWTKIWVNGEVVHENSNERACALDQDRFTVSLKKGANSVLIKEGNNSGEWNFCLRVAEGNATLALAK